MGESVSFRATRMVYGDTNEPPRLEVYTYDSDQDLITVFNVDLDGTLTGSFEGDSLSITESLGITINPVNDAPVVGFLQLSGLVTRILITKSNSSLTNNISDVDITMRKPSILST